MTRERKRCTLTLSPAAVAQLARVGNQSGYVDHLILQHAREWTEAIAVLREHGWRRSTLLAACEALDGDGLSTVSRVGSSLAAALASARAGGVFAHHDVATRERNARIKQLRENPIVAYALATIVREFSIDNAACEQAIGTL
jgi:hypothetical protein